MINVIGLGYIGLPTALILAKSGNEVVGTDINEKVVSSLKSEILTFKEWGMEELYIEARKKGIEFTTEYRKSDIYIITVPTPYEKLTKRINMDYVIQAVKSVVDVCGSDSIVVIESTVSPGSIDRNIRPIIEGSQKKIQLAHAPERIIPGNMLYELENNSRTIGVDDKEIGKILKDIYSSFCKGEIIITDIKSAEMSKVIENTYRDINIAFANELAKICRSDNIDVYEIIRIANKHPRVNILTPGPGVGGHCISVDPWFLVGDYPRLAKLTLTAREINDSMPEFVLNRISCIMQENGIDNINRVGIYGLTYKENVDDVRESPTLQMLNIMKRYLASHLLCYDPFINYKLVDKQVFTFLEFINQVDFIVIMVAHKEIIDNFDLIKNKIILDTRKCIENNSVYRL